MYFPNGIINFFFANVNKEGSAVVFTFLEAL